MPFRYAYVALLLLMPAILLAFWPGYFGQLGTAPFALHAHGITATLWVLLATWQSWTIQAGRRAAHRIAGLALFFVVPAFISGTALAVQAGAALAAANADPFHARFGVRLALYDLIAELAFLALVCAAILWRRRIGRHAGAMLATILLVFPPILARLLPLLPGFPNEAQSGIPTFALSFELSQLLTILLTLTIARRTARHAAPFLFVAAITAMQSVLFETFGRSALWRAMMLSTLDISPFAVAAGGIAIGVAALALAWARGKPPVTGRG